MAIRVQFLADVIDYLRGSGKVTEATKENADGLEDLMRKGIELGRELGKTNAEIARDFSRGFDVPLDRAMRAVEEVTGETKDLEKATRDVGKAADTAGGELEDGVKKGSSGAGEALSELGSIAQDVLSGDFSSAAQTALSSLGTIATSAGIGGAVGGAIFDALSGLVASLVEKFGEYDKKVAEVRDSTSAALVEMGGAFDQAAMQGRLRDIVNDTDKWAQANFIAQQTGLDLSTVLSGLAGDAEDARRTSQEFSDVWEKIPGNVDTQVMYDAKASLEGVTAALDGAPDKIDAVSGAMSRNAERLFDYAASAGEATGKTDDLGNAIVRLPNGKEVVIDAKTQQAFEDINAVEQKQIAPKTATVNVGVNDQTGPAVDAIVRRINGRMSQINVGINSGGRQLMP